MEKTIITNKLHIREILFKMFKILPLVLLGLSINFTKVTNLNNRGTLLSYPLFTGKFNYFKLS